MDERKKRAALLKGIRPDIPNAKIDDATSPAERFQNVTLRPIIKLQHDLFLAVFKAYFSRKKIKFDTLNTTQKTMLIEGIFARDNAFKLNLKGIVLGQMTVEEYTIYAEQPSIYNKRIFGMLKERILSVLD